MASRPCCGQGTPESMITQFNQTKTLFQGKQHPHSSIQTTTAMTTQQTFNTNINPNSFGQTTSNINQFTSSGFLKYVRGFK